MSLEKLKRTLHREFMRNPAKSITLLALLPVAGYFVGPVVWKQLPKSKSSGTSAEPPVASFVAPAAAAAVAAGPGSPALPGWQDLAQWMDQDPRLKPAAADPARDPFRPVLAAANPLDLDRLAAREPAKPAAPLRPEDCGLQLTATIVGRAKRLAAISGRLYAENARVPSGDQAQASGNPLADDEAFVLKTVTKNYVVLERHGEEFQLTLARGADQ